MSNVPFDPLSSRDCALARIASGVFGKFPLTKTIPHSSSGAVSCRSSCQSVMDAVKPSQPKSLVLAGFDQSQVV